MEGIRHHGVKNLRPRAAATIAAFPAGLDSDNLPKEIHYKGMTGSEQISGWEIVNFSKN